MRIPLRMRLALPVLAALASVLTAATGTDAAPSPAKAADAVAERPLPSGRVEERRVLLRRDEAVEVTVETQNLPVVVSVFSPEGERLETVGSNLRTAASWRVPVVADAAGDYRVVVRTFFPDPAGSLRISVGAVHPATAEEKGGVARRYCRDRQWDDSSGRFQVKDVLQAMNRCMAAVARTMQEEHPEVAAKASATAAELDYLAERWHWGEDVSPAYREHLLLDYRMLREAAGKKEGPQILDAVTDDIAAKADHCRNSSRGLGGDISVVIETRKGERVDAGWRIYYKLGIYAYVDSALFEHFPMPSSPTKNDLPPGKYIMWGEKPGTKLRTHEALVRVGAGKKNLTEVLFVP